MKLSRVKIKDFRSFSGTHDLVIAPGVSYFVGPNNCGKSNLIRAIELALDPDAHYDPVKDRPTRPSGAGAPNKTRISLTFKVGNSGPERTLLRYAEDYESAVRKGRGGVTYASAGELHVVTTFQPDGSRTTSFAARGSGANYLAAESLEHRKLDAQFQRLVRFGVIHSGEDLESVLQGKFRQILQLVIEDHLQEALARAEQSRAAYLNSLQSELLEPLRRKVLNQVSGLFPEITIAQLVPNVPTVDRTLSSVGIQLGDLATTDLAEKGTGVRGAVLISMLQYMAEQSRRSLVMAVEEPEAFLHPAGQEEIGRQLEQLATRADVSLLVTTHSPYVVGRTEDGLVTELYKTTDGVTRIAGSVRGDEDRAHLLGSLYRDPGMSQVLERALAIPSDSAAVVVTEGYSDGLFIKYCCEAVGRPELLEGIHFIPANGAAKVVVQAILAQSVTQVPVLALLDHDPAGRAAHEKLSAMNWSRSRDLISLNLWPGACGNHDIEIEDLLPQGTVEALVKKLGYEIAIDGTERCKYLGWHYHTSKAWKEAAIGELPALLTKTDAGGMVWLAECIKSRAEAIARSNEKRHSAPHRRRVNR